MNQSFRILINTSALYIKIVISALVTLISTRIVLEALGAESFGLYNLIAGVIAMLSFLNGSLMVSSQRFLSIAIGEKDKEKLTNAYNVSLLIHFFIAVVILIVCKIIQPFLFNSFLNIPPELYHTSIRVYNIMILSIAVTLFTIPYSAAINAREDMLVFSISEILVAILKLAVAYSLFYVAGDRLLVYTVGMLVAIFIGGISKYLWCRLKYAECRVSLRRMLDKPLLVEMGNFAGWNTLVSIATVVRNQGVSVVLNVFFGTLINAAYGIANQLNSLVITFASTLTTVFTPMIIRTKGEGNNDKMLFIATFSSKMSFFLSSLIALPTLLFTSTILEIWLTEVPGYSIFFCKIIICTFLIMQLYPGITRGLYAEGNIKWYQIIVSLILISILPVSYYMLSKGYSPYAVMITMVVSQALTLVATVIFAGKKIELPVRSFFIHSVIFPAFLFAALFAFGLMLKTVIKLEPTVSMVVVSFIVICAYIYMYMRLIFGKDEKNLLKNLSNQLLGKLKLKEYEKDNL